MLSGTADSTKDSLARQAWVPVPVALPATCGTLVQSVRRPLNENGVIPGVGSLHGVDGLAARMEGGDYGAWQCLGQG